MSNPLRIALVVEGPTDSVVLRSVIGHLLEGRDFEPVTLQPELSEAFKAQNAGGWTELYLWCRQAVSQAGGKLRDNPLFTSFDILVVQVDADVAEKRYSDDQRITDPPNDLPCVLACPPPSATTDALRQVVLRWMGETAIPAKTVLCTPSKSLETWVLVALFPGNSIARRRNIECHANPETQLQIQPKGTRLIQSGQKKINEYRQQAAKIAEAWPTVRVRCTEADRFSLAFLAAVP